MKKIEIRDKQSPYIDGMDLPAKKHIGWFYEIDKIFIEKNKEDLALFECCILYYFFEIYPKKKKNINFYIS